MYWANLFHIYQPPNWPAAIIRKVARESYRPLVHILKRHPQIHITLNVSASLTEQLHALGYQDVIRDIRSLAQRKQIELTGTAIYHPILPKLPPAEIKRQIQLNTTTNKKLFGTAFAPRGIFLPEMAYSQAVAQVAKRLGFRWMMLDEIAHRGTLGTLRFDTHYIHAHTKQSIVYRNRFISDYLAFQAPLQQPEKFWHELSTLHRSDEHLVTGMDGEGLGHHRPGAEKLWERLVTDRRVTPVTISELLTSYQQQRNTTPRRSSWSSRPSELQHHMPYILWDDKQNPMHPLQWELVRRVIRLVHNSTQNTHYLRARKLLDARLASDQFWWASAKPWWSKEIVDAKTQELVDIVMLLQPQQRWATRLAQDIIHHTAGWQHSKKYKKVSRRYLASSPYEFVTYIGGKKISK